MIVGAGHNGLVAACYLARAGRDVLVLEALDRPGGGARTEECIPGYRFDLHSVAHNIINMTGIPADLDLAGAGLEYLEMDPFSIAVREDGRRVRFFRSVDATVESIAEASPSEADAYRNFVRVATPVVRAVLPSIRGEAAGGTRAKAAVDVLRAGGVGALRDLASPYGDVLARRLRSDLTRGPVAAFAAHAGLGPDVRGGALFAFWQAAYHLFGQWHARGGAQGLTDALVTRLRSWGGEVRCSTPVARILRSGARATGVVTRSGEQIPAANVVTAIDPKAALLELLDPPLDGRIAKGLRAARRGNVVQAVVHVATDALPPYANARRGDWNGLQSFVDRLDDLSQACAAAEAHRLPDPLPVYAFTSSALDPALAPPGHHTVYLACPTAPFTIDGGWPAHESAFVDAAIEQVERRAPGFRSTIRGVAAWTPDRMETEGGWPGAHPMHLDITLGQLGPLRPTRRLGSHRTPVTGLYISGAGTSPTGGIAGTPGKLAARALLADAGHR